VLRRLSNRRRVVVAETRCADITLCGKLHRESCRRNVDRSVPQHEISGIGPGLMLRRRPNRWRVAVAETRCADIRSAESCIAEAADATWTDLPFNIAPIPPNPHSTVEDAPQKRSTERDQAWQQPSG
jgi:hypothetical protein